ncbi:prepilin-type N-terminal cleavage/methylation domain-containing protein [Leptolyngbya sp. PCC 6406]|uniref:prepilin-type N-terminal cleavage/methylation domain-containing protein n=1 Tax=Leptolyngbya sp. PCC 6406 TaxID=1173264 RepID=UPI0002AD07F3|nr:prepilin-type N-terminal cleavage/methylation domain-containing protein [Leptolyngbya sp. PCC 6406]
MSTQRFDSKMGRWFWIPAQDTEAGLTLIECLVAIIVVGISVAAIAPAMVLTVATRVQSQKADQALNLAQAEIDRIRLIMERGSATADNLPLSTPTADIRAVTAPISFVASTSFTDAATQAIRVDANGDGSDDFAIQVFRDPGVFRVGQSTPLAFSMGVRVYDIRAEEAISNGDPLGIEQAAIGMTSGEGQRRNRPLAILYTNVLRGDASGSLCTYADSLAGGASTGLSCN